MKHILLIITTLFLVPLYGQQQQNILLASASIRGTVKDAQGLPLISATVLLEGTKTVTTTDASGFFELTDIPINEKNTVRLSANYVGFETQLAEWNVGQKSIDFVLAESFLGLDEVVVTGYVQTRRNARTSAISEIKATDMKTVAAGGFNEQIQGKTAGLLVSTTSGTPGSSVFIRLRGTTSINAGNEPLYIIDGVPINNKSLQSIAIGGQTTNPLADINPADIESIQVLKDANATAVYGARGANGVLLISTSRGKKGAKTKVSFNSEYGFAKASKLWDLATGPQHAQILNEAWVNDGKDPLLQPYRAKANGGLGLPEEQATYDRQKDVFRTASTQTYNVSVSGGNSNTNFYVGAEYTRQESILKTQDFARLAFRVNLDHQINDQFSIGTSNMLSHTDRSLSRTANSPKGILQSSVHTATLLPPFKEDGSYAKYGIFDNLYALIEHNNHKAFGLRSINNVYAKWNINKKISFKSTVSVDLNNYHEKRYFNTQLADGQPNGNATDATTKDQTFTVEQLLNYISTINNKHFVSFFLGNSLQKTRWEQESITGSGFPSDQFERISSAAVTTGSTNGSRSGLISYFGGLNYSFASKYSLDMNVRADASSRFGTSNQWGYFPSAGVSWRVSEEGFLKNRFAFLNEFKLKASLGWTGNQDIEDFASRGLWSGGGAYGDDPGIVHSQLANPDLKWETTRQWNLGWETAFFQNRLTVELNYYHKFTYDLLLNVPAPAKTGFASSMRNLGQMSNTGLELSINSVNYQSADWTWTSSFNLSHNKNRIEKLPISFSQYSRDWVRLEQGASMYSFWLYKQLYVDPQTGNAVYDDSRTNDGKITTSDRQLVGNASPYFTGGLQQSLRYKNIDFSASLYFSVGNDVFNMNRFFQEHGGVRGTNWSLLSSQMDRWQKPGDQTDVPKASTVANADGSKNNDFQSSRFLEDGSFLRLRSLSLAYNFPKELLNKAGIGQLRIYASATNLLTLTNYSGADPEGNTAADQTNGTVQGLDFAIPPQPRTLLLGVQITF